MSVTAPKKGDHRAHHLSSSSLGDQGCSSRRKHTQEAAQQTAACPTWNPSCSGEVAMSQTCSVPAQPSPALPVPLERGCELGEPHVRQLHSQGFFVHCLLNHSPSWSIFSLVMHYLQMLVETKSTLDVPISFLSASQDIDSLVIFC